MFSVHVFLDNEKVAVRLMEHLPRMGDTVRLDADRYATVAQVAWCFDEENRVGQRVNLGLETEVEGK